VFASDVDPLAPALYLADEALPIPRTSDPGYLEALLETVKRHAIRLVIPTIDTDLSVLASNHLAFESLGCRVAVSGETFVAVTLDKLATGDAFASAGFDVPRSWAVPVEHVSELEGMLRRVPDPVIQELLSGPEITIDALLDLGGRPIHYVPRLRIRTVHGESIQGMTLEHDSVLETWIETLLDQCSAMGALGPQTIQAFLTPRGPVLSEINPRFGGGFPLALAAGADYPSWLLDMIEGIPVAPRLRAYEAGLYMTRYYVEQFTREPKW
jgi:carbamoyl-phosphate synthase large subunit